MKRLNKLLKKNSRLSTNILVYQNVMKTNKMSVRSFLSAIAVTEIQKEKEIIKKNIVLCSIKDTQFKTL